MHLRLLYSTHVFHELAHLALSYNYSNLDVRDSLPLYEGPVLIFVSRTVQLIFGRYSSFHVQ